MAKLSEAGLTRWEKMLRMNIRNAYLAESVATLRAEAVHRAAQGKWFETAVLLELATEE